MSDKKTDASIRSLRDIWPLQAELNARCGFDTQGLGQQLRQAEAAGTLEGSDVQVQVGRAIKNYLDALGSETQELNDCLSWKHWYAEAKAGRQYQLNDVQNARVEAADLLFFWISICQLLGLTPDDVYRLYEKKLGLNHKRQDENRTQAEHGEHEHENREVI